MGLGIEAIGGFFKGAGEDAWDGIKGTVNTAGELAAKAREFEAKLADGAYSVIGNADKWASSGIDSIRSDTPGLSQAASVTRAAPGFGKDMGLGLARLGVMVSPPGQVNLEDKAGEFGAKLVSGEIRPRQVLETAKAIPGALVKPVTDAWNRGDKLEAVTRGALEVGSLILPFTKLGKAGELASGLSKAGEAANTSKAGEAANAADKAAELGRATKGDEVAGLGVGAGKSTFEKESLVAANKAKGKAFEEQIASEEAKSGAEVHREITIRTNQGTKVRMDILKKDSQGKITCIECKSSEAAPLTKAQRKGFPEEAVA